MEDKKNIFSKDTLIPVGFVISIAVFAFVLGGISQRVDITERRVNSLETTMKDLPTRNEFNALKEAITTGFSNLEKQINKTH
jgi:hypothetical protein